MRPIRFLDENLLQSVSFIALEKTEVIEQVCNENSICIVFTEENKFGIEVYPKKNEITLPTIMLEHLWCASYFFYTLYQEYCNYNWDLSSELDIMKNPRTKTALGLYEWSVKQIDQKQQLDWPNDDLKPENLKLVEDISVANELFLCVVAWMLHHEIAHIRHDHKSEALNNQYSREEERQADETATSHILGGVSDEKVLQKRGLGIVIAILVLISRDILDGEFKHTSHPKSFERIYDAITPYFKDSNHLVYAFSTIIFHYHMQKMKIDIEKDETKSWKVNFESCLVTFSRLD